MALPTFDREFGRFYGSALAFTVSVFYYPVCFRQGFDAPREDPER